MCSLILALLESNVKVGDKVNAGDGVLVIEAMKMEATITANTAGVVRRLAIGKTSPVDAGDLLLVVEPA